MKIFIAGIMQGSLKGKGIQEQAYRKIISKALKINHPDVNIVDPFSLFPDSVAYDDKRAKEVLFAMADEAASSNILIAYLPEASMGTALEMIRAYDNQKPIFSITPMNENWLVRAVSTKVFPTLETFCTWIKNNHLKDWL